MPAKQSNGKVQETSVIIFEFTDNKCLALKPASCEPGHEAETLTRRVGKGRGSSEFADPQTIVLSQRPIKTTACKISRYVPPQAVNSIPGAYRSYRRANCAAIVSAERAGGMDDDPGVWMYPRADHKHRQCLPDSQTQESTAAMSRQERVV